MQDETAIMKTAESIPEPAETAAAPPAEDKKELKEPADLRTQQLEKLRTLQDRHDKAVQRIEQAQTRSRKLDIEIQRLEEKILAADVADLLSVIRPCEVGVPQVTEFMRFVLEKWDIDRAKRILERNV